MSSNRCNNGRTMGGIMSKEMSVFDDLFSYNANEFKDKKGEYDYLSWSDAVAIVLKKYPDTTWEIHEFDEGSPYKQTDAGAFVKVSVTIQGVTRTHTHPILSHYMKAIPKPNAFDVNSSILRCLVKCFALFGLGLYIYQGEDLPFQDPPSFKQFKELETKNDLAKKSGAITQEEWNITIKRKAQSDFYEQNCIKAIAWLDDKIEQHKKKEKK